MANSMASKNSILSIKYRQIGSSSNAVGFVNKNIDVDKASKNPILRHLCCKMVGSSDALSSRSG